MNGYVNEDEKMTVLEEIVLDTLREGSENAISSTWFEDYKGINRRTLCEVVKNLRKKHVPIGSNRTGKRGYYIIDSQDDLNTTIRSLASQIKEEAAVLKALKEIKLIDKNQITLDLGDGE